MAERGSRQTIVMFPFMAQGHIIPFVALALHIQKTQEGRYLIVFVNTPRNIALLKTLLPSDSSIRFVEIPFHSSAHSLPPNIENSDSLSYDLFIHFLQASTSLRIPFRDALSDLLVKEKGEKPLFVIGDIFFGWMGKVCRDLGVFHVIFSGTSGFGLGCYSSIWVNLPQKDADGQEFLLPDFPEAKKIHRTHLNASMLAADGTDAWSVFQLNNILGWPDSDGFLFNTVEELDKIGLLYFKRKLGIPVWAVGPILLPAENRASAGIKTEEIKRWLDGKPQNSVIYISFGSMNTISATHMSQLAMALDSCGKNFIWVVRPPIGFDINGGFRAKEWLPDGFEDRLKETGRGILVEKWAPQIQILAHKSTSAFLTHCGWNSVLESLSYGVPMLGWPMAAEQFYNAKWLEESGVCVEVARGKSCEVRHEDIAEKMRSVTDDTDKGREMRTRGLELKDMVKRAVEVDGSSVKAMDDLLSCSMKKKE